MTNLPAIKMMKKLFFAFGILLSVSSLVFAQSETEKPADWKTFAPENEEFWIDIPIAFNASVFEDKDKGFISRRFTNIFEGTYFYIFSDSPEKPNQIKFALKFAYHHQENGATEIIDGLEVKKFEFPDNEDFYHTILIVNGKSRFYVFQSVSPTKDNPLVKRFFGNLRFKESASVQNGSEPKTEKDVTVTIPTAANTKVESNRQKGSITVTGNGNGSQNAPETKPSPTPVPNNVSTGVKILTKPRANYTEFARFYAMAGKVTLRVVFSANGSIGSITPISKLPFGLTEQAIIAARGIRFEPAMRNGVAYSVIKPVEYNFTIY